MGAAPQPERIKTIYGTFFFGKLESEEIHSYLSVLDQHSVRALDTASGYKDCEKAIGKSVEPGKYTIHTKAPGFVKGCLGKENVLKTMEQSLVDLNVDQVETLFLHTPDSETPISETLAAINELHTAGKFKHFGLSNHLADEVSAVYNHCKENDYVLPTVYEGNYNPVARRAETELLPLLRELGMSFYAYSPLAGGFLVRDAESVLNGSHRRFDKSWWLGKMYSKMYARPKLLDALPEWHAIAKAAGCSPSALAYRWVAWNSPLSARRGDGLIVGATKVKQLEDTMADLEAGPLPSEIVSRIDALWEQVKDEAPLDDLHL